MIKDGYFDAEEAMARQGGDAYNHALLTIAARYLGAHPPHPPVYRITRKSPVRKQDDHRYVFPVSEMYPGMQAGQRVYAWGKLWSDSRQAFPFHATGYGPMGVYHNGVKVYGSSADEETPALERINVPVTLEKGWNRFVLEFAPGERGCGGIFGTGSRKNKPYVFVAPAMERDGEEGWLYTEPLHTPLPFIPSTDLPEDWAGVKWLPEPTAQAHADDSGNGIRPDTLYGSQPGLAACAWSRLAVSGSPVVLEGEACGPVRFTVRTAASEESVSTGPGSFRIELRLPPEEFDLTAWCESSSSGWGFSLTGLTGGRLALPYSVRGAAGVWLCLGPLAPGAEINMRRSMQMTETVTGYNGEETFWITSCGGEVRPFLENEAFGRWNYPLGVTLYGLLELGRSLGREELTRYVQDHVQFAVSRFGYSLWDRARYGAAGLNNQLSHIDSLDDCGSFGALMLAACGESGMNGLQETAEHIADYILHRQDRLEDGTLYRRVGVSRSMDMTMWCDDMYMSIPFLVRYARWSGRDEVLDEAASQMLLYRKYLYMPDQRIMSHVFDVRRGEATGTPWGRGNGWVLFSLAELLTELPEAHPDYKELMQYYRELCAGYAALQGDSGLWHQVLTDPESYEETSCTSMFIYAFARGVRLGWHKDPGPYREAVRLGWQGLKERSIDKYGNVYGVCRGSSFSFSNRYYKHDLGWNLNDTHGIGIVLLAGLEAKALRDQAEPV